MIEGLKLLPFTAGVPIFNCDTCLNGDKKMNLQPQSTEVRIRQACGLLPRRADVKRVFGVPDGVDFEPSCCPGYLTSLPEVQEAVRIRPQWLKGTASLYLRGSDVNEDLEPALNAQSILESAVNAKQAHETEKRAREAEEARRRG